MECERRSACSGCHQQSSCGTGTRRRVFPMKAQRLRVALTGEVAVGQQIRLGIPRPAFGAGRPGLRAATLLFAARRPDRPALAGTRSLSAGVTILSCLLGGTVGFFTGSLLFPTGSSRGIWPPHARRGAQDPPSLLRAGSSVGAGAATWCQARQTGLFLVPAD